MVSTLLPYGVSRASIIIHKGGVLSCPVLSSVPSYRIPFIHSFIPFTSPIRDRRRCRFPVGIVIKTTTRAHTRRGKQKSLSDVALHLHFYIIIQLPTLPTLRPDERYRGARYKKDKVKVESIPSVAPTLKYDRFRGGVFCLLIYLSIYVRMYSYWAPRFPKRRENRHGSRK